MTRSTTAIDAAAPVDNMYYINFGVVVVIIVLAMLGAWQVYNFAQNLCPRKRKARQGHTYFQRSVGTQSQCTYNGIRYIADTQGFRRSGEVTVDMVYNVHYD